MSEAVLLKSPWDTDNSKTSLHYFTNARFVYTTRQPAEILDNRVNALLAYLDGPQFTLNNCSDTEDCDAATGGILRSGGYFGV